MTSPLEVNAKTIAFVGDSISTGAITHPSLQYDLKGIWEIFRGETDLSVDWKLWNELAKDVPSSSESPPKRLWPTAREFHDSFSWLHLHILQAIGRIYLDTEEYSWAYTLSRRLGYDPNNILIAAQDGAHITSAKRQIDRVLDQTKGVLPDQTFLFFTGDDLCGLTMDHVITSADYADDLKSAVQYLLRNGTLPSEGADIYIVGFLSVMQLAASEEILAKSVTYHGKTRTCGEIHAGTADRSTDSTTADLLRDHPEASFLLNLLPQTPGQICPTVFSKNIDAEKNQRATLANRIRAIREASRQVAIEVSSELGRGESKNARIHFLHNAGSLMFKGEDIANDCFHLSARGQARLADTVLNEMRKL